MSVDIYIDREELEVCASDAVLYEMESSDNITTYRYVPFHEQLTCFTNFIDIIYYDETEIFFQEMMLNIQEQL